MGSRLGFRADCRWAKNIGWDLAAALKKKHDAPHGCPACRNTTLAKSENRRCLNRARSLRNSALVKPVQPPLPLRKLQEVAPWPAA